MGAFNSYRVGFYSKQHIRNADQEPMLLGGPHWCRLARVVVDWETLEEKGI